MDQHGNACRIQSEKNLKRSKRWNIKSGGANHTPEQRILSETTCFNMYRPRGISFAILEKVKNHFCFAGFYFWPPVFLSYYTDFSQKL